MLRKVVMKFKNIVYGDGEPKQEKVKKLNKTRWLVILVVVTVVCTGLGALAGHCIISPQQLKMQTAPPEPTLIAEKVQLKKIENTIITRGSIVPESSYYIGYGALSKESSFTAGTGSDILTNVFVKVGDEVNAGDW
ncbi:MAG: hypothetical protein LBP35_02995 [Candidatus Ancillula trichonymphae]|jgi:multidrug efflux pump subunit AcrA (membrane-fusion protein)|nr:hypothetical protein [Candidatus Ancillula trichonymphae]